MYRAAISLCHVFHALTQSPPSSLPHYPFDPAKYYANMHGNHGDEEDRDEEEEERYQRIMSNLHNMLCTESIDDSNDSASTYEHHKTIDHLVIIELGCGPGLVTLFLASLFALKKMKGDENEDHGHQQRKITLIATDGDEKSIQLTKENLIRNGFYVCEEEEGKEDEHGEHPLYQPFSLHVCPLLWGNEDHIQRVQQLYLHTDMETEKETETETEIEVEPPTVLLIGSDIIACPYVQALDDLAQTCHALQPYSYFLCSYQERIQSEEFCQFWDQFKYHKRRSIRNNNDDNDDNDDNDNNNNNNNTNNNTAQHTSIDEESMNSTSMPTMSSFPCILYGDTTTNHNNIEITTFAFY